MTENIFRKELLETARCLGCHIVDIPDELKRVLPILPPEWRRRLSRMIAQKPYDLAFVHEGNYYPCELKLEKLGFSFNLNKIEPHQIRALQSAKESGAYPFILINFRKTLTTPQQVRYNIKERLHNVVYCVTIDKLKSWIKQGKKSMTLAMLEENCLKLNWDKSSQTWELEKIFKYE